MYVALTRARNHLLVTYPLNAYSSRRSSDYSLDQLSRFLDKGVRDKMQRVALGSDDSPAVNTDTAPPAAQVLDLRALLRSKFKA